MRKLRLQVQVSVDGFIADTNGSNDWMLWSNWDDKWNWDDELKKYISDILGSVDCILLSRKMATGGFFEHWQQAAQNPEDPRFAYASKVNEIHKVVFSKTLKKPEWDNTTIASGDLVVEINKLKNQNGKDIIVYGGATLASSLIKAGLIDELQLLINPVVLGNGMPIFDRIDHRLNLQLIEARPFDCGIVVQIYESKKEKQAGLRVS